MRPPWDKKESISEILDLSQNVCIDSHLPVFTFDPLVYDDPYYSYKALSEYHNVSIDAIAIGLGLSELIVRILTVIKHRGWSMMIADHPTWQPVTALQIALKIPTGTDVLYVADPNGNNGQRGSISGQYKLIIRDKSYADFTGDTSINLNELTLKTFSKSLALPGARFGWVIGPKDIIQEVQDIRPARVTIGGMCNNIKFMLSQIKPHVSRMNETKQYLESKYSCVSSLANYVLFKNPPQWHKNVQMKKINDLYRMSLVDMDTLHDKVIRN